MSFELELIEAKLALNRILPEEWPALAQDAMEAGYDGPNLRRLSAFDNPTAWETERFLSGAKHEMGMNDIDRRIASLRLSQYLAHQMLEGKIDPIVSLSRFERFWIDADHPIELSALSMLADEIEYSAAILRPDFHSQVVRELEELVQLDLHSA